MSELEYEIAGLHIYLSVSECAYRISLIVAAAAAAATKKNKVQGMRECSRMNAGDALM